MAQLYFHCASSDRVLLDRHGSEHDDLVDAHSEAIAVVQRMIATPGPDDWRGWKLLALDENEEELFQLSFASVIGRLH